MGSAPANPGYRRQLRRRYLLCARGRVHDQPGLPAARDLRVRFLGTSNQAHAMTARWYLRLVFAVNLLAAGSTVYGAVHLGRIEPWEPIPWTAVVAGIIWSTRDAFRIRRRGRACDRICAEAMQAVTDHLRHMREEPTRLITQHELFADDDETHWQVNAARWPNPHPWQNMDGTEEKDD